MLRRDVVWAFCALAAASSRADADPAGTDAVEPLPGVRPSAARPPFWVAQQRRARVYLLGFGEATDRSWLTPSIQRAFDSSSQLWLEIDQSRPLQEMNAVIEKHGRDANRPFLDSLEPHVRERAVAYLKELDIKPETVETMRPWFAYYTFAFAFDARRTNPVQPQSAERALAELATQAGRKIGYEKSMAALVETFALMPDKAQSQYIEWLFDYFDEKKAGPNEADTGWIAGNTASGTRSLDRMRRLPELYRIMQPDRNAWWARKIVQLLRSQEVHFVAVGQLHVLGPDGIPRQLQRLGVDLIPNPAVSS